MEEPVEEIRKLREAKGWSRAELARQASMSASEVGKIEAGRVRPYDSQVQKIAAALGVTPDQLPGVGDNAEGVAR